LTCYALRHLGKEGSVSDYSAVSVLSTTDNVFRHPKPVQRSRMIWLNPLLYFGSRGSKRHSGR